MCTVGGRIGWIVTRSGTARRPGIPGTTTPRAYKARFVGYSFTSILIPQYLVLEILPKNTYGTVRVSKDVVVPGIPGLRAVPDLVTIHPILPPTVHIQPYHD